MVDNSLKFISKTIGLALLIVGFFISVLGFGDTVNATWGSSIVFRGFAEFLFGISFMLLGNGLVNLSKPS